MIAGVINGHVAAKYVYVRIFRGGDQMHKRNFVSVGSWIGITLVLWIIAWIIAEAIPVFNNLLSLIVSGPLMASEAWKHILMASHRLPSLRVGSPVGQFEYPLTGRKKSNLNIRWSQWHILAVFEPGTIREFSEESISYRS